MAADEDGVMHAGGEHAAAAGPGYPDGGGLPLAWWFPLHGRAGVPPWMRAELVRLQAAFPAFSFSIRPGWRGLMFEAWREADADGLYAVITKDAGELWRELDRSRSRPGPVAGRCGGKAR